MDLATLNILVIDDDDADRKMIKRLLKRSGYEGEVVEAPGVDEARDMATRNFDVVFLDYYLPGTTGLTFLPELRGCFPRAAIFLMTGQGNETVAKSAILNGATDYIAKSLITNDALRTLLTTGIAAAHEKWKIEQQRRDLATFSEVLVHDFNAPIRAAAFLAEQVGEDLEAGEMEDVHDGLRLLKKSARQMNEMIRSLADHIRLDRDDEFTAQSPASLVDAALTALALVIQEAAAKVTVEIDDDVPDLHCSGPQIAQLLQNLINNAIKFSPSGSADVTIRVATDFSSVRFEVADKGVGIPPEHLETIFQPFKRAPGAQAVEGTGLGLSTCRKIVLRHDGVIRCDSVQGVGTTMVFSLPRADTAATPLQAIRKIA